MSVTLDLLAILQITKGTVGQLYYLRKLAVYNLTIYESPLPNNAYCLCWNETHDKKGSNEIGTCIYYYVNNYLCPEIKHLAIFSDTCSGQNRNQLIAVLLLWAVQHSHVNVIEQKLLESGHTYMEEDSMHSPIEYARKYMNITSMNDWKMFLEKHGNRKLRN